jgi:hypothetical protein
MADSGKAEKRSGALVVGGSLEVLLHHEGSRGTRQGRRRRTAMTMSVSSPWRGKSMAVASISNGALATGRG